MDPTGLVEPLLAGDRRALARTLRIIEDRADGWESLLAGLWPRAGNAHLVGITGAPGVGKSTLTNALLSAWRALDRRIGVLAVDPASPFTGGALLGDRIRMQDHVSDPGVFVRSMSSRGRLGGLAEGAASLVGVLAAAGFDPVLVETVGVGQSEIDVVYHADTVVVMVTPRWGNGIQVEKAGILEVGDIFVINKADSVGVDETRQALAGMVEANPPSGGWTPPVLATVATTGAGVEELIDAIDRHRRHLAVGEAGRERRRRRARMEISAAVAAAARNRLDHPELEALVDEVSAHRLDPWEAARTLLESGSG